MMVPNVENESYKTFSSTFSGSRLPMNRLAPTSREFCPDFLSRLDFETLSGLPKSFTIFIICIAYSASLTSINSTNPYPL